MTVCCLIERPLRLYLGETTTDPPTTTTTTTTEAADVTTAGSSWLGGIISGIFGKSK